MKDVEASGLIKFDFLGLKNLDIIDEAVRLATDMGHAVELDTLRFQDPKAYAMLANGDGFAVFQVESAGMRRAMSMLQVDSIEDLIALISLYRPGPMDQIATYAQVKSGEAKASYAHPSMADVLDETYGVMVYQEQVMKIAQVLAGYSLGEADLLRRAMGKKIQAEMMEQRERFIAGAQDGWVMVDLEDGTRKRLHARETVVVNDGTGRRITLQEALETQADVLL
jgi:DNA polymerase-3 subunit alpha